MLLSISNFSIWRKSIYSEVARVDVSIRYPLQVPVYNSSSTRAVVGTIAKRLPALAISKKSIRFGNIEVPIRYPTVVYRTYDPLYNELVTYVDDIQDTRGTRGLAKLSRGHGPRRSCTASVEKLAGPRDRCGSFFDVVNVVNHVVLVRAVD